MPTLFASFRNSMSRNLQAIKESQGYDAFKKKPHIMISTTLLGGMAGGFFGTLLPASIIYASISNIGRCTWGNYVFDHAKDYQCSVSGDPCSESDGNDGSSIAPTPNNVKASSIALSSTPPQITYTCVNGAADEARLKKAADDYVHGLEQQANTTYYSGWNILTIAVGFFSTLAGLYGGYRVGLSCATPRIGEDIMRPFLDEQERLDQESRGSRESNSPQSRTRSESQRSRADSEADIQMQPMQSMQQPESEPSPYTTIDSTGIHSPRNGSSGFHSPRNPRNMRPAAAASDVTVTVQPTSP